MSNRILTCGGVIQREKSSSAAGSGSSMPASSATSRTPATRWSSPPSTAPPGNTQAPPMKRASGLRRTSRTSSRSAPPRSTITVAAWRGSVTSPVFSSSPDATASRVPSLPMTTETVQKWICQSCGFIYDPAEGDPDGGIPPGTAFDDIPTDWFCPVCGARKADFEPFED